MIRSRSLPSLKIYLFFAIVSLLGGTGCDLDIDFGGSGGGGTAAGDEEIRGSVTEVVPAVDGGVSGLFVRFTSDEDGQQTYSDSTSSGGGFSLEGDMDPGGKLEVFETEAAESALGSIRLNVFPGAELNVGDIEVRSGAVELTEDIIVRFSGRVSDASCSGGTGTLEVDIAGRDREVLVQVTSATDFDIRDNDSLECDSIIEEDQIEIRGALLQGDTVRATDIIID